MHRVKLEHHSVSLAPQWRAHPFFRHESSDSTFIVSWLNVHISNIIRPAMLLSTSVIEDMLALIKMQSCSWPSLWSTFHLPLLTNEQMNPKLGTEPLLSQHPLPCAHNSIRACVQRCGTCLVRWWWSSPAGRWCAGTWSSARIRAASRRDTFSSAQTLFTWPSRPSKTR